MQNTHYHVRYNLYFDKDYFDDGSYTFHTINEFIGMLRNNYGLKKFHFSFEISQIVENDQEIPIYSEDDIRQTSFGIMLTVVARTNGVASKYTSKKAIHYIKNSKRRHSSHSKKPCRIEFVYNKSPTSDSIFCNSTSSSGIILSIKS